MGVDSHLFTFRCEPGDATSETVDRLKKMIYDNGGRIFIGDINKQTGICKLGIYSSDEMFEELLPHLATLKDCWVYK